MKLIVENCKIYERTIYVICTSLLVQQLLAKNKGNDNATAVLATWLFPLSDTTKGQRSTTAEDMKQKSLCALKDTPQNTLQNRNILKTAELYGRFDKRRTLLLTIHVQKWLKTGKQEMWKVYCSYALEA